MLARFLTATALVAALLTGCGPDTSPEALRLPPGFPDNFPFPPAVQQASEGDALVLRVPDTTVAEIEAFYREELPAVGWEVVEGWTGVDPDNRPTSGLVIDQGGATGAIAFTAQDEAVIVRINLRQPANQPEPGQ